MMYKECEYCGATLDAGEKCDCAGSQKSHDEYIVVIAPNGKCTVETYAQGTVSDQLRQLQKLVGGYIQIVPYKYQDFIMIVDEEGVFKDTGLNRLATEATGGTPIMGTAVIAKTAVMDDGEEAICGMSIEEVQELTTTLKIHKPSL